MIKVKVFPLSNSRYTSQIYSGLFDLAAAGEIDLQFTWFSSVRIRERDWGKRLNNRIVYLEIWGESGSLPCKVCYDMLDGPEVISLDGLEKCDVYFKRSYSSRYMGSQLDTMWQFDRPELKNKILPYGLNFPCGSQFEYARLKRQLIFLYATGQFRNAPVSAIRSLARTLAGRSRLGPLAVEVAPDEKTEPYLLFQTRLFDPDKMNPKHYEENVELNEYRVAVLRALKKEFGHRLVGGLIPDDLSRKRHRDLLTNQVTSREEYLKLVKKCQVVVFTKGLRLSTGWRLPEYLAMSRCIVSEPLEYELPRPLRDGGNYLLFGNPDECVEACTRLIDDKAMAQEMRVNNYSYYHDNVKASSLIRNTIDAARHLYSENNEDCRKKGVPQAIQ